MKMKQQGRENVHVYHDSDIFFHWYTNAASLLELGSFTYIPHQIQLLYSYDVFSSIRNLHILQIRCIY